MAQYGPTSAYSVERFEFNMLTLYYFFLFSCESFDADIRAQNIYSNRLAPSRDIGKHIAVSQYARHIIDGGHYDSGRCNK